MENLIEATWGYNEDGEAWWPAALAALFAVFLYISLPDRFITGPIWILPTLILIVLIPLFIDSWKRDKHEKPWHRFLAISLIAILNSYNISSIIILIQTLLNPMRSTIPVHGQ